MTDKNPNNENAKLKHSILAMLMIFVFLLSLKSRPDQQAREFLRVNSPDRSHIAKVSVMTIDTMKGYYLSVSVFDNKGELVRSDFYRQWNCGNVAIKWKTDDVLTINGVSMSWASDTIEFGINGGNDFCPVRSIVY